MSVSRCILFLTAPEIDEPAPVSNNPTDSFTLCWQNCSEFRRPLMVMAY